MTGGEGHSGMSLAALKNSYRYVWTGEGSAPGLREGAI
jgi:hypothetical protein